MKKFRISNAYEYETQSGEKKVMVEAIPQINKPVFYTKKIYLTKDDAQAIFGDKLKFDESGLWLFGKVLLVQESYALDDNKKNPVEDEE